MIRFLLKGLLRDHHRSFFPLLIITVGVALCVLMQAWMDGRMQSMIERQAHLRAGHVKVVTQKAWEEQQIQSADLALTEILPMVADLQKQYPQISFRPRILFAGLLDVPDERGETRSQGPVFGYGIDLLKGKDEIKSFRLEEALVEGRLPKQRGEFLASQAISKKLKLSLGQKASLITSDLNGSMVVANFKLVGLVNFGIQALDRGAVIADLEDLRTALDLEEGATELIGIFKDQIYHKLDAKLIQQTFNQGQEKGDFHPKMLTLHDQDDMGVMLDMADQMLGWIVGIFIFILAIVLWNAGLMSGIRRYREMGLRIAMGEEKNQIYLSLIVESFFLGLLGTILGVALGLIPSYLLQIYGWDLSGLLQGVQGIMMENVVRARVTINALWAGLIPGLAAPFIGTLISGLSIYGRDSSRLLNQLENQ